MHAFAMCKLECTHASLACVRYKCSLDCDGVQYSGRQNGYSNDISDPALYAYLYHLYVVCLYIYACTKEKA